MDARMYTVKDLADRFGVMPGSLRVWLTRDFKIPPTRQDSRHGSPVNKYDEETAARVGAALIKKAADQARKDLERTAARRAPANGAHSPAPKGSTRRKAR